MTPATPVRFPHLPPIRWVTQAARAAMWLALLLMLRCGAQSVPGTVPRDPFAQPMGKPSAGGLDDVPNGSSVENEKLFRTLNVERQKSMVSDTNKLLRLVNELNAEIAHNNPDSLTPAQWRKVAEIEKLAHNVKDKMSTSVRGTPSFQQPPTSTPSPTPTRRR